MISAACLRSDSGMSRRALCCWHGIRTALSRCTMRTMDGRCALRLRSRRCWPVRNVSRNPEPAGWVGFCLFGSVPEPFTTYQEIRALPAGSTLWVDRVGTREAKQYFSIADTYCRAEATSSPANDEDQQVGIREALLDSVRHHLVADVPVGAFLSSGIDSGALVGLMRDAGQQDIQTVTLAFEEFRGRAEDEAPIAAEIAAQYGTRHTTRVVTEREFQDDLPKILERDGSTHDRWAQHLVRQQSCA